MNFAIKNGDGRPVDGTKLTTFASILGGPTKSYSTFSRQSGLASGQTPGVYDAASRPTMPALPSARFRS